jgi:NAD(P)-dependent dehydrogenase (short-subunit alcohol dehydrogenase family)
VRIAILGLRSIGTSASGGIEKAIEELATRFVAAGHQVTVFCRKRYVQDVGSTFKGVHLKALPAIYTKHLEAISNTVVAVFSALRGYDVIHINATGPALLSFIPRMLGRKVVVTVHGSTGNARSGGPLRRLRFDWDPRGSDLSQPDGGSVQDPAGPLRDRIQSQHYVHS